MTFSSFRATSFLQQLSSFKSPSFITTASCFRNKQRRIAHRFITSSLDKDNNIDDDNYSSFKGFGPSSPPLNKNPKNTADALRESLGGVSNAQGRVPRGTNVVFGTDDSEEKWRELDNQVNQYPCERTFKVIGSGGEDFAAKMTVCVENVLGKLHDECVSSRYSSNGKWISVTISAMVETPEQVLEIYNSMKSDSRLKYFI